MTGKQAEFGVIGGSGLYSLFENPEELDIDTEYGKPSDKVSIGTINGRSVAFVPRHGRNHTIPPHMINYRANLSAFASLGVQRVISITAVGSLRMDFVPGDFAIPTQFINMTSGRKDTYFDGEPVTHVSTAFPYCPEMHKAAVRVGDYDNIKYHENATIMVINGPRFSTMAESKFFNSIGADIINMTQYPEVVLAKELGMCYSSIAVVTDYDAGIEADQKIPPVSFEDVGKRFSSSIEKVKTMIADMVKEIPNERSCDCSKSLDNARVQKG
ncbi:MAG: S-methyl-5'-thioadenosine phosphorylase [Candidatus Marsarchaeota archaeon]|nr:S-methyl-5'-thioadenosine phosphorylase [Candidatus Marsarchaeota archaeon]